MEENPVTRGSLSLFDYLVSGDNNGKSNANGLDIKSSSSMSANVEESERASTPKGKGNSLNTSETIALMEHKATGSKLEQLLTAGKRAVRSGSSKSGGSKSASVASGSATVAGGGEDPSNEPVKKYGNPRKRRLLNNSTSSSAETSPKVSRDGLDSGVNNANSVVTSKRLKDHEFMGAQIDELLKMDKAKVEKAEKAEKEKMRQKSPESYTWRNYLKSSSARRTKPNEQIKYKCKECDKEYEDQDDFISHTFEHTGGDRYIFKCTKCGKKVRWKSAMLFHIKKDHKGEDVSWVKNDNEDRFKPPKDKSKKDEAKGESPAAETTSNDNDLSITHDSDDGTRWQCTCGLEFPSETLFLRHRQLNHTSKECGVSASQIILASGNNSENARNEHKSYPPPVISPPLISVEEAVETAFTLISTGVLEQSKSESAKTKKSENSSHHCSSDAPDEGNANSSKKSARGRKPKHINDKASGNVKKLKKNSPSKSDTSEEKGSEQTPPTTPTTGSRTSLRRNIQKPKWLTDADLVTDYEVPRGTNSMRTGLNPVPSEIMANGSRSQAQCNVTPDPRKGTSTTPVSKSDRSKSRSSTSSPRDREPKKMKGSEDIQTSGLLGAKVSTSPQLIPQSSTTVASSEIIPTIKDAMNAGPFAFVQSVSFADLCTGKVSPSEITKPTTLSSTQVSLDSNGNDGMDMDFAVNNEAESELLATGEGVTFVNTFSEEKSGEEARSSALTTEELDNVENGGSEKEELQKVKTDESEKEELDKVETGESEKEELPKDETGESETLSNFTSNKEEEKSQPLLPPTNSADEEDMPILRPEPATNSAPLASVPSSLTESSKSIDEENVSNNSNNSAAAVPAPVLSKEAATNFSNACTTNTTMLQVAEENDNDNSVTMEVDDDEQMSVGLGELPLDGDNETNVIGQVTGRDRSDSLSMRSCGSGSQSEKIKGLDDTTIPSTKEKIPKVVTVPAASRPAVDNECLVDTDSNDSLMSEFSELAAQVSENTDGVKLKEDCLRFIATKVSSDTMWAIRKELKRLKKEKDYFKFGKLSPLAAGLMHDLFCQSLP